MSGLNNEIKNVLALSGNIPQLFQEIGGLLQWLDNQIRARETGMKGKPVPGNTNTTL
jgi:hypothetical protein